VIKAKPDWPVSSLSGTARPVPSVQPSAHIMDLNRCEQRTIFTSNIPSKGMIMNHKGGKIVNYVLVYCNPLPAIHHLQSVFFNPCDRVR